MEAIKAISVAGCYDIFNATSSEKASADLQKAVAV